MESKEGLIGGVGVGRGLDGMEKAVDVDGVLGCEGWFLGLDRDLEGLELGVCFVEVCVWPSAVGWEVDCGSGCSCLLLIVVCGGRLFLSTASLYPLQCSCIQRVPSLLSPQQSRKKLPSHL
ncbi:unnamed protein product [Moneuplotes crassus]|uniref:Uncharacterized protein n=1 Tax=Euplotes crassus TaxID=5936 RepID=A0AAD1UFW1_EUPCR|nr:unnamed protein product [Moneuplotes crassus]